MSGWSAPKVTPDETAFELDRFELVGGDRYEVEGRWSGVRGRVFIRPELTLIDGGQSRRLLADLADKPWKAADGDTWTVAFPCPEATEVVEADLTVAPDITVAVRRGRARRTHAGETAAAKTSRSHEQRTRKQPAAAKAKPAAGVKRRGLGVQLAEAKSELEQVRDEQRGLSERLEAEMLRAEEAQAERDRTTGSLEQLAAERDALTRALEDARAEHSKATRAAAGDREAVERSRDEALSGLEQTRGDLEQTRSDLERTRSDLKHARETIENLETARDSAIRAGIEVERELNATNADREHLLKDREQLTAEQDMLQVELKRLSTTAEEIRAAHQQQPIESTQPVLPSAPPNSASDAWHGAGSWESPTHSQWRHRAIAIAALAAAVVVVLILVLTVF